MARRLARTAAAIAGTVTALVALSALAGCAGRQAAPHSHEDRIVSRSQQPTVARGSIATPVPTRPQVAATPARTVAAAPEFSETLAERGLLVVGASYTQGLGARPQTQGFAYQLGRELGWRTQVSGVSGTGFVNPGPHHEGTFAARIARLHPQFPPGIVLIQGGRNDSGVAPNVLYNAVQHTVSVTRTHFHGADLAFLGPIPGALPVSARQQTVEHVLARAASADGVLFIDPVAEHWISPANVRNFQGSVRGHPNNAGYAYIAHRLAADLRGWSEGKTA